LIFNTREIDHTISLTRGNSSKGEGSSLDITYASKGGGCEGGGSSLDLIYGGNIATKPDDACNQKWIFLIPTIFLMCEVGSIPY